MQIISKINKFFVALVVCAVPITVFPQNDDNGYRLKIITDFYDFTNNYARNIFTKGVPNDEVIYRLFDTQSAPMQYDIKFFDNHGGTNYIPETGNINDYLDFLSAKSEKDSITFHWCDNINHRKSESEFEITVMFHRARKGYTCMARFAFKGEGKYIKISSVGFERFKEINYSGETISPPPLISYPHINFSAGWKITNGVNFGIGIDGISKNWFINHLRFGVEYNMLFNQERDAHYPTSTDGASATMTYRIRENDDYGLGINIGYRIIPGKYDNVSILGGPGRLFLSMGGGIVRYGRGWEYQGTAEPIKHPRNTAFYIKPALTLEYSLSDYWGIGMEASYYLGLPIRSPQYSQINGVGLNAIINYAF